MYKYYFWFRFWEQQENVSTRTVLSVKFVTRSLMECSLLWTILIKFIALRTTIGIWSLFYNYSGTLLIQSPMGQKKLAILTSDCIIIKGTVMVVCRATKKSGRNNKVTDYWGGRKAGFHCNYKTMTKYL